MQPKRGPKLPNGESKTRAADPLREPGTHTDGAPIIPRTSQSLRAEQACTLHVDPSPRLVDERALTDIVNAAIASFWDDGCDWASNVSLARYLGIEEKGIRERRDGRKHWQLVDVFRFPRPLFERVSEWMQTQRRAIDGDRKAASALVGAGKRAEIALRTAKGEEHERLREAMTGTAAALLRAVEST